MGDSRAHRGPHPEDGRLFAPSARPRLCQATADLCWLLSRGYAGSSAVKLVGDHYNLTARQRTAVARCSCSDAALAGRRSRQVSADRLRDQPLWLDGYNVLTTVEAALAGGVMLLAHDGAYRDMASMHGSYRKVSETRPALVHIGRTASSLGVCRCLWYLDRPVSNSGRLKTIVQEVATEQGWSWDVELVADPDPLLAEAEGIVATADSVILDRCRSWFNLARRTIDHHVPEANVVALSEGDITPRRGFR